MLELLNHLNDSVENCFKYNITWEMMMRTYWFMLFVEFPRYYLLDLIVVAIAKFQYWGKRRNKNIARFALYADQPLVSIIVPGKNEGAHIYKLVRSLAQQTYKNFELIVVDDGSNDMTPIICRNLEQRGLIDRFFRMEVRGGKASAANYAAYHSKGKYIVHLDADSSLDRDALENILIPFYYDPDIKGVGGCVKVRNGNDSLCAAMQQFEYLKTIQIGRMVTSELGIYHIISGAFGAFERETLQKLGYWDIGPGLDGDITQKIRKSGKKVYFAEEAICLTNVPTKWKVLFKQRMRWSKSLIRFRMRKHSDILRPDANFSLSNFLSNMDNIMFDCVFNYLWFFYIITLIWENHDNLFDVMLVGWLLRFVFATVSFGVIMLVSERSREEAKLILLLPFQTFYTGYFLRLTRLIAHTMEFFLFSSYADAWNPRKTSVYAQMEGM